MSVKRFCLFLSCVLAVLALAASAVCARGGGAGGSGGNQRKVRGRGGGGGSSGQRGRRSGGRSSRQGQAAGRGRAARGQSGYGHAAPGLGHQYGRGYQHQYQHRQAQGAGQGGQRRWQYNHAEERTMRGMVVEEPEQGRGRGTDKSILVRSDDGTTRRVQLGPAWFADDLDLAPQPGDTVELTGAAHGESGAVQARELNWNGYTYRFRNEEGSPLWAGAARESWSGYAGAWNSGATEELTGEIEGIEGISPGGPDMGRGVVLRLRTREGERERERVHLGPYWYVEDGMPGLRLGQRVTVRGARGPYGDDALMAMEMERKQQQLRLRTRDGRPEWAGGWQNWDGWGPGSRYSRRYRPDAERSVEGIVERIEEMTPMPGMGRGLALNVRTREGARQRVHVGPMWFAEQAGIAPAPGEPISLTGSVVAMNGKPVLMVREMSQANRRVRLRERDGTPVWSGRAPAEEMAAAE